MSNKQLLDKALQLFDNGKYDEALEIVEQVLSSESKNALALSVLCSIKIIKEDFVTAQNIISSMDEKVKNSKVYWKWMGQIEAGFGNTDKAISAYKKALTIDSKYSQAYNLFLMLLEKIEDYTTACEYLFKAISNFGLTDNYQKKLENYQKIFARVGGIQAPNIIKISGKEGTIKIERSNIESIGEIQNLDITKHLLTELRLLNNKIKKISNLEKLTKLRYLALSNNDISKIEGLENLENLTHLFLGKNTIKQIEGLDNLKKLKLLNIDNNNLSKITGLENLKELSSLYLNKNQIESMVGIEPLTNLLILELRENNIREISCLEKITKLMQLQLSHNKLTSMKGLENNSVIDFLYLDHNNLETIANIEKMPKLQFLDLQANENLHPHLARTIKNFPVHKQDIIPYLGLRKDEVEEKKTLIDEELKLKVRQQLAKESWERQMNAIPGKVRFKFLRLYKTNTKDKCLYCGQKMSSNENWIDFCQEKIKLLLQEANNKLPEKLRSKITFDLEKGDLRDKYEMKGAMGQKTWQKTGLTEGIIIKDIRMEEQKKTIFSGSDYITPKGTICKKCTEEFVNNVAVVFDSVTSTKSAKRHEKMHQLLQEQYYKVFEALVDKALN